MQKVKIIKIILLLLFIVYIYYYLKPTKYEKHYLLDEFQIVEKFDKEYYFSISNNNYKFEYLFNKIYSPKRRLIKEIDTFKEKEYFCIYFEIEEIETFPTCYEKQELIDFRLIDSKNFDQFLFNKYSGKDKYINKNLDNYLLYYDNNANYAIWNYKGIDYIKDESIKKINLFEQDIYDSSLLFLANKYLFVPNFNQAHSFNESYIINLESGDYNLWKMPTFINYESYILGNDYNKIYIVDQKEIVQYELDLENKSMRVISTEEGLGKILNKEWQDITMNKLINNKYSFFKDNRYDYIIYKRVYKIDNQLNQQTLISNIEEPYLITYDDDNVYYLKDEVLYNYNNNIGETKIMSNYEWNFNHENKIFVFGP